MRHAPASASTSDFRLICRNRRARFDYELAETLEAGLVLIGSEVRSLRDGAADLSDAWVEIDPRREAWVKGLRIAPRQHAAFGHSEKRPRKLLLHGEQIRRLRGKVEAEGMTLIVTQCYFKRGRVKVQIALARGRKKYDKRQLLRERDAEREARDAIGKVRRS